MIVCKLNHWKALPDYMQEKASFLYDDVVGLDKKKSKHAHKELWKMILSIELEAKHVERGEDGVVCVNSTRKHDCLK